MSGYTIRPATAADGVALTEALVEAASWDPARPRPRVEVLEDPVRRRYIAGWPKPGDVGVVAVDEGGQTIGACWYRLFPADRPGLAGVSGIPELILGVRPVWRAQGVGRSLLREVIRLATEAGHARIALSVERGNFAQRLYVSEGFTVVSSGPTADVMIRTSR